MDPKAAALHVENEGRRKALTDRVNAARQRLTAFCHTGDSESYIEDARAKRISIESPSMKFQAGARRPSDLKLDQWGTTVLSSPQAYPAGLDIWLQSILPRILPSEIAENSQQLQAVRDGLYQRLLGNSSEGAIRVLAKCAISIQCGIEDPLTVEQSAEVATAVSEIEQRIRQQRWAELAPPAH
ncbi:hypothetical protein [Roseateles sp. YR242]|uniref:hypothetical protein n=1 Tax=Roseateles sp. YR242 TaxID=1855305 RepID=UPI000B831CA6|nr:hypothetical protein [Roseateles sp. YR242]